MSEGVPCKKCGKIPYLQKYCGDNGSNMNGVMWAVECDCGNKTDPYKSQMVAIAQWGSDNKSVQATSQTCA